MTPRDLAARGRWRLSVDTGGTFTDCLAFAPDGRRLEVKVLSSGALRARVASVLGETSVQLRADWDLPAGFFAGYRLRALGRADEIEIEASDEGGRRLRLSRPSTLASGAQVELLSPEEAPLLAARVVTRTPLSTALPPIDLRLGTTRGTNALLQRKGATTALLVTEGFADLLRIGTQQRPDLFALDVHRPRPLPSITIEVHERLDAHGQVLTPLNEARLRADLEALRDEDVESVAIVLLHAHCNPRHEEIVERLVREAGYTHVSRSSEVAPFQQLLARGRTCVIDAYLSPVIEGYLQSIRAGLGGSSPHLHVMTSAGGLVSCGDYRPKDSLLSGPAAGVVGAAAAGRAAGFTQLLSLDMGGTSTDVARIDDEFEYVFEHQVGDAELLAPALAIETVAAGGGSLCGVEHGRLVVGPQSAGAVPGSACYGAGGPLTLTDVNLLLGRIRAERLPIPIDETAARLRLQELIERIHLQTGVRSESASLLEGWLRIADERMAEAMRRVSLRRGYDPREYALLAFGGAGGQHACAIAERLAIETVLAPPSAGVLSALGLHHARLERFVQQQVLRPLRDVASRLGTMLQDLSLRAIEAVVAEGVAPGDVTLERRLLELRYEGQDSTLALEFAEGVSLQEAFEARHEELFAHRLTGKAVELVALRVVARSRETPEELPPPAPEPSQRDLDLSAVEFVRAFSRGEWTSAPCLERSTLRAGDRWEGPALVVEDHALFFLEAGWRARVGASGCIVATRDPRSGTSAVTAPTPAAVTLELFRHRFESMAREMGEHLRRTAVSTNIKERLDFSCALLDAEGRLVVNAPHIPVHLGALGLCVRTLREAIEMRDGDVVATNHPAFGGSHLPDVTVVGPVHDGDERLGYVAVRAHHAEIGGITPGSMPARAQNLSEEGVVLPPLLVVDQGKPQWEELEQRLRTGPYPTRAIADNLADLRAMVASARGGAARLRALSHAHGAARVAEQMDELRALALRHARAALRSRGDGQYDASDEMDDGSALRVKVTVAEGMATIDFTGSAAVHPGNLNATEAIVRSAVLYVLRLLVAEPLPLNEGLMEAVDLVLPRGMLHPVFEADPVRCPAIVGGNVETSQRIVDVLLRAFEVAAASQGTMNNVSFGNEAFGYYETLGGGAGAGDGFHGESGVHTHMTNTRLTDVEVLEHRYPVRVLRLALRTGSGGAGRWRGGDGLVRELEFLVPVTLSVLTQRRQVAPFGMRGGAPGTVGTQRVHRATGERVDLRALDSIELDVGDRFVIETPGGGGFGEVGADEDGAR